MKPLSVLLVVVAVSVPLCAYAATSYLPTDYTGKGVSLSLTDPDGSVYQNGESVRLLLRTDADGYVAIFNIDTDGYVHLLYPRDARSIQRFSQGREYAIPERDNEALIVSGKKGMEMVFAVFAPRRDDFDVYAIQENISDSESGYAERIDGDPFIAANRVASRLVPGIATNPGASLAFTYFHVIEPVDFPRYLCGTCEASGSDPWGPSGPDYVAVRDFERTNQLAYPLVRGFDLESNLAEAEAKPRYLETTRTVYVDYRPGWDRGYYWGPWGGYSCYPYYPGWFVSVGFGWGWGHGWGHHHSDYYYPWYPIGGGGYDRYTRPNSIAYRTATYRSSRPYRYKNTALNTALARQRTFSSPSRRVKSRSIAGRTTARPHSRYALKTRASNRSVTSSRRVARLSRRGTLSNNYRLSRDRSVYSPRTIKRIDTRYFGERRSRYDRTMNESRGSRDTYRSRSVVRPTGRSSTSYKPNVRTRSIRSKSTSTKVRGRSSGTRSRTSVRSAPRTRSSRSATSRTSGKSRRR
ncbi:MAG: DUF4384 domain-containing protein [bacterium]|nr:DUF4384 domain-containing protein [bacterium]